MQAPEEKLAYLLKKYGRQECTEAEATEMLNLLQEDFGEAVLAEHLMTLAKQEAPSTEIEPSTWDGIWLAVRRASGLPSSKMIRMHRRWVAAAAVLFVLISGTVVWQFLPGTPPRLLTTATQKVTDMPPARDGAILTLADGQTILLDESGNGVVASQNGVKVELVDGQLTYNKQQKSGVEPVYNTMSTPKGRLFRLVLPDGSKVWMNAASSLRYPTFFAGKERKVEITGEAYFEVATNRRQPFRVVINGGAEVEVLGTSFNVNSYTNEAAVNITLLEGAIRCVNGTRNALLHPGQQAQILSAGDAFSSPENRGKITIVNNADLNSVMAWKNGVFNFNNANLEEVMRQLERWYDIEVVYPKGIPKLEFIGKMGRDLTLSEVLAGLEMSKVRFRIEEGRKLIIMP